MSARSTGGAPTRLHRVKPVAARGITRSSASHGVSRSPARRLPRAGPTSTQIAFLGLVPASESSVVDIGSVSQVAASTFGHASRGKPSGLRRVKRAPGSDIKAAQDRLHEEYQVLDQLASDHPNAATGLDAHSQQLAHSQPLEVPDHFVPYETRVPELELGVTPHQLQAFDYLLSSLIPRLSDEHVNRLQIKALKQKAEILKAEYATFPLPGEVGAQTERVTVAGDAMPAHLDRPRKLKSEINFEPHGFIIDPSNIHKFSALAMEHSQEENANTSSSYERRMKKQKSPFIRSLLSYYELTKPRIAQMVAVTSLWGYWAVGNPKSMGDIALLTAGTVAMSSAASIVNQIRETDVDARMTRTMARPLVTGIITIESAKRQVAGYMALGTALLAPFQPLVAILGLANVGLYGGIYTSLKRKTPLNTEIGALVGAIPPIMGYFAALNVDQAWDHNLTALLYPAAMMISWQIQHVMLICVRRSEEYNASGLVMQCKDDPDLKTTIRKGIAWAILSTAISAIPHFTGQGDVTQLFSTYMWAVYTGVYGFTMKQRDHKKLGQVLMAGYVVLGLTIGLSLYAQVPADPYAYLITSGPEHPSPLPETAPTLFEVLFQGAGRPSTNEFIAPASQGSPHLPTAASLSAPIADPTAPLADFVVPSSDAVVSVRSEMQLSQKQLDAIGLHTEMPGSQKSDV